MFPSPDFSAAALPAAGAPLTLQPLFPVALGQVQLRPDPLDLALQLQALLELRGGRSSNPDPDCAWTGDLNGVWQLHRHPTFAPLVAEIVAQARQYLHQLGFDPERVALHLQRCWPVLSEPGQVVGRHHHPNAHLSAVYYFNGDGSGRSGCLRFWPQRQVNELVPGMAVGHGGPLGASPWTQPWVDVAPRAGLLLLFPSALDHAVLPNEDLEDLRCSLSLDFVLTAPRGTPAGAAEYLAPHPAEWHEMGPVNAPSAAEP
ncbi:MAG: TIGR02466 family protein [Synechococcus sp.]|nr:TIGR02466 family protein [Synechococcus sp.]